MAELYSQYESGAMFTAGALSGSVLGASGINPIVDRLNSISPSDDLVSGTSVNVYGTSTSSTTVPGLIELATEDEVQTGTDTARAVVPDTLQVVMVPVGSIVAWLKTLAGVPQTLPVGWVLCDGSAISDADSPMDGQNTPDLNGGEFLRGSSTTGGTGGASTVNLAHTHTGPNHTHPEQSHSHTLSNVEQGNTAGSDWKMVVIVNGSVSGYRTGLVTSLAGTGNTGTKLSSTTDNKPPYYNVVWIMRIK